MTKPNIFHNFSNLQNIAVKTVIDKNPKHPYVIKKLR